MNPSGSRADRINQILDDSRLRLLEIDWFEDLSDEDVAILYYRFVKAKSLRETGELVPQKNGRPKDKERVRQLQNVAIARLRRNAQRNIAIALESL